jgi:hypothetical protein
MVTTLLKRLGNLGLLLVASALLLGGLAGAAVAHHFEGLSAGTVATHQQDKGKPPQRSKNQHDNQRTPHHGRPNVGPASNGSGRG